MTLFDKKPSVIMGIDNSTNSLAFAIKENDVLIRYDKILFKGDNVYQRAVDARKKCEQLRNEINVDSIGIEKTVRVRSTDTAIKMAIVAGAVISVLAEGAKVLEVPPITWQIFIGNKLLTVQEKNILKKDNPGKSASWYQNAGRLYRKQRTMNLMNDKYGIDITDNDIGDAVGIMDYLWEKR